MESGDPPLIDSSSITSPRGGFYDLQGEWAVENEGVAPDYPVEMIPAQVIAGHDPQLEKAVEVALNLLESWPDMIIPQPDDPVPYSDLIIRWRILDARWRIVGPSEIRHLITDQN